jgi:demethoxyubiquinone hydroxylase (CLK1/Coq7/Cat5 family)
MAGLWFLQGDPQSRQRLLQPHDQERIMNQNSTTMRPDKAIDALNSLLKGEISATETYLQAIQKLNDERLYQLRENLDSHRERVGILRDRIIVLGGEPAQGSGLWGAFTRLLEGGAKLFGKDAAIAALEQGEDIGLADYAKYLRDLDADSRALVEGRLLPAQQRTHRTMSDMKHGSGPSRGGVGGGAGLATMLLAAIALGSFGLSACHEERHTGVRLEEVPPPVQATITKLAGQDTVAQIREEREAGGTRYHVVVDRNGEDSSYTIDETGAVR